MAFFCFFVGCEAYTFKAPAGAYVPVIDLPYLQTNKAMKKFNFVTGFIQGRVRILDYYSTPILKNQVIFLNFCQFLKFFSFFEKTIEKNHLISGKIKKTVENWAKLWYDKEEPDIFIQKG